jgi:hypothetical protein
MQQVAKVALLTASLGAVLGCGGKSDRIAVHPFRSKVVFSAPEAASAMVVFHPVGNADPKAPRSFATLEKDGSFELSTFDTRDGAPVGDYAVTLT